MDSKKAKFFIGQLIHHTLFDYRGVIIDVDPSFQGTQEWYDNMALSRPSKQQPWYHVLVHDAIHHTYAAEQNLAADTSNEPIIHPELDAYFSVFEDGKYKNIRTKN